MTDNTRAFTVASDAALIELIRGAKSRLAVISPALTKQVADALVARLGEQDRLYLTVVLDADPEVYRLGHRLDHPATRLAHHWPAMLFGLRLFLSWPMLFGLRLLLRWPTLLSGLWRFLAPRRSRLLSAGRWCVVIGFGCDGRM